MLSAALCAGIFAGCPTRGGEVILSTGINCAFFYWRNQTDTTHNFFIGGTKLIQPTNKDSAPCSHYGFRDLKKLKLWRCEV
jgi:hypothetical protein